VQGDSQPTEFWKIFESELERMKLKQAEVARRIKTSTTTIQKLAQWRGRQPEKPARPGQVVRPADGVLQGDAV
jgi:hypothetical protein